MFKKTNRMTPRCHEIPPNPTKFTCWCCWLCGAGDVTIPFEEIHTETPTWYQSLPDWIDIPPWGDSPCGLMENSLGYNAHPAKFYLPDLFHIYLAGFGQDHAGSCLVYMLGILFQGSSVEKQLDSLNSAWRLWKRMFKVSTHTYNFTRNMLNFLDAKKVFPTGTWSKASDTPKILEFILYVCSLYPEKVSTDKVLYYIQSSCQSIGVCMKTPLWLRSIYGLLSGQKSKGFCFQYNPHCLLRWCFQPLCKSSELVFPQDSSWFGNRKTSEERNQATKVVESGMHYMRCYAKLASKAHALHRPLWVYKPKIHYFHHILLQIKDELYRGAKPYNVLAFSCAMAEDFIG